LAACRGCWPPYSLSDNAAQAAWMPALQSVLVMSSNAEVVTAKNKRLAVMPKIKSFMGLFAYIFNDKTYINSCQRLGNKKSPD